MNFSPSVVFVFNEDLTEFEVYTPSGDRITELVKEKYLVNGMALTNKDTGAIYRGIFVGIDVETPAAVSEK